MNRNHEHGKLEERIKAEQKRTQSYLRVQNSLSLALCASQKILTQMSQELKTSTNTHGEKDPGFAGSLAVLTSHAQDFSSVIDEAQVNLTDLFKLQADSYINAVSERRKLWLNSSTLKDYYKRQLSVLPITVPHNATPSEHCLLGVQGRKLIKDWADHDITRCNLRLQQQAWDTVSLQQPGQSGFKAPQNKPPRNN